MSIDDASFLDLCLAGKTKPEDIDDAVEAWHLGDGSGSLADHLGMTHDQYWRWVRDPRELPAILVEHQLGKPLSALVAEIRDIERGGFIGPDRSHAFLARFTATSHSGRESGHART
ncbi:hypothetical protein [Azospirillum rugosum]|uniref:Helix-turn-helix domain-containing protein n=1 Tax=Azospirillum rugosum TaxID=416170 RepID=A0ABS4SVR3_9PROT|nr:hypothetical protein [Azospirillum rugosum]MBP2296649.1 hypothetical protein [Azospirillum rugosum]MDQ0530292.1 hypothetical protein [Azospirillum rugosum]